jgi:hypothetical protein
MPRYDLMHWSQRVRDHQQAAYAPATPVEAVPEPRRAAKPRTARPKPPRDEQAEQLLRLCREGRLFELQAWVAAGKPLWARRSESDPLAARKLMHSGAQTAGLVERRAPRFAGENA